MESILFLICTKVLHEPAVILTWQEVQKVGGVWKTCETREKLV